MDRRGLIVLFLALNSCSGQTPSYTCETNPGDNNCYCVLDSDTDNWFVARSNCRQYLNGELVNIASENDNWFVRNMLGKTGKTDAWLGVTDINQEETFVPISDPEVGLLYTPTWVSGVTNDATQNCVSLNAIDGYWDVVDCYIPDITYGTMCMVETGDPFGYNLGTGCPLTTISYGNKCYGVDTLSSTDAGFEFGAAHEHCQALTPTGNLVLPKDAATNDFVTQLAKFTEFGEFWLSIERSSGNYVVYGDIATQIHYANWANPTEMASFDESIASFNKFVMFADTGLWGYTVIALQLGVICEFDSVSVTPTNQPTISATLRPPLCGPAQTTTGKPLLKPQIIVSLLSTVNLS